MASAAMAATAALPSAVLAASLSPAFPAASSHWRNRTRGVTVRCACSGSPASAESAVQDPTSGNAETASMKSTVSRRAVFLAPAMIGGALVATEFFKADAAEVASPPKFTDMPALRGKDYGKSQMRYPDYTLTESGLQYKDLRDGNGPTPEEGQTVVIDWDGFTIGYYGRIFEARNKTKGGSFEGNEKEFFRFRLGKGEVIDAFEEAVATMHVGGIRRIVVPPEIGYPNNDFNSKGPRPLTFSGQRALDFVLKNQGLIDKTLLFDIELLRVL